MKLLNAFVLSLVFVFLFIGCSNPPPAAQPPVQPFAPPVAQPPAPPSLSELVDGGGPGVPYTIESFNLAGSAAGRPFFGFYSPRIITTVTVTDGFITSVEIEGLESETFEWGMSVRRYAEPQIIAHNSISAGLDAAHELVRIDIRSGATATIDAVRGSGEDAMLQIVRAFEVP